MMMFPIAEVELALGRELTEYETDQLPGLLLRFQRVVKAGTSSFKPTNIDDAQLNAVAGSSVARVLSGEDQNVRLTNDEWLALVPLNARLAHPFLRDTTVIEDYFAGHSYMFRR